MPDASRPQSPEMEALDKELAAMTACLKLLADLDPKSSDRVLRYLAARLGVYWSSGS